MVQWHSLAVVEFGMRLDFTRVAARLVDNNADGAADIDGDSFRANVATEDIYRSTQNANALFVPAMARVGYLRGNDDVSLSLVGSVARTTRFFTMATPSAAGLDRYFVAGDFIANWRRQFRHGAFELTAAWHRNMRLERSHDASVANDPQFLNAYVPQLTGPSPRDIGAPELATACRDSGDDRYPQITNCPIPGWLATGGPGRLIDATADRPSVTADYQHRIATHSLRVGATVEDSRVVNVFRFSGGRFVRSLFPGHEDSEYYLLPGSTCDVTDLTQPCKLVEATDQRLRERYMAGYLEDTWRPQADVAINGGVRWESLQLGSKLKFNQQIAPRVSVAWDPLGSGRSRVYWSYGRAFAMLPLGVLEKLDPTPKTARIISSDFGTSRIVDGTGGFPVFAGVEPITVDEVVAGAEASIAKTVSVKLWGQSRWQRQTLETTPLGFSNLDRYTGIATKQSQMLAAEVATNPLGATAIRFGYQWNRVIGATTGAFDPQQGDVQYAGRDFDAGTANLVGRLPTDGGQKFYADVIRVAKFGRWPVTLAGRAVVGSGRPRSALAVTDVGTVQLLPRGSVERTPLTSSVNLRASVRVSQFDIGVEIFNVFNRKQVTSVGEVFSRSEVQPIHNGTSSDLVFVRDLEGKLAVRSPGYGLPSGYQSPIFAVLSVRSEF
jgi:hypothetical protein